MKILAWATAALMVFFIYPQHNDWDGLFWAVVYGLPGVLAVLFALGKNVNRALYLVCFCYLFAALTSLPAAWEAIGDDHLPAWTAAERFRESGGLAICGVLAGVLRFLGARKPQGP